MITDDDFDLAKYRSQENEESSIGIGRSLVTDADFDLGKYQVKARTGTPSPKTINFTEGIIKAYRKDVGIHPTFEGVVGATIGTMEDIGSFVVDSVPYLKWGMTESRREQFANLSPEDKKKVHLHETFSAALWAAGYGAVPLLKLAGRAVKTGVTTGVAKLRPKMAPVEDMSSWTAKYFDEALDTRVKGLGLRKGEQEALRDFVRGDAKALQKPFLDTSTPGVSKGYAAITERAPGVTINFKLKKGIAEDLSPEALRKAGLMNKFNRGIPRGKGKELNTEAVYESVLGKFVGQEAARGAKISHSSITQMENVVEYMLGSRGKAAVKSALETNFWAPLSPVRRVFEKFEGPFSTYSKVYLPIKEGLNNSGKWAIERTTLLNEMFAQRGLKTMKFDKEGRIASFKWIKEFTPEVERDVEQILVKRDALAQEARKLMTKDDYAGHIKKMRKEIDDLLQMPGKSDVHRQLVAESVNVMDDFFSQLYKEEIFWSVQREFTQAGLTPHGANALAERMSVANGMLDDLFKTQASRGYTEKLLGVNEYLARMRNLIDEPGWFTAEGEKLLVLKKGLRDKLGIATVGEGGTMTAAEKGGGILPYLEAYHPRAYKSEIQILDRFASHLSKDRQAFYEKLRTGGNIYTKKRRGLGDVVSARIGAQARKMHLHDALFQVTDHAQLLPADVLNYTEHYVSRIMGMPSTTDHYVAKLLQTTEKITGNWDAFRIMELSKAVNDFTYMGFLGLKPFSAIRNLFQPLIMVPADLGGTRDILTLAKGYVFAAKNKQALDAIGVLSEYAPELPTTMPRVFGAGKTVAGLRLPEALSSRRGLADFSLWAFKGSDTINRYVSGGAAYVKWEEGFAKIFGSRAKNFLPDSAQVRSFMKTSGANGRTHVTRTRIEDFVRRGQFDEARKLFVKDVVADTQYLYGHADSPLFAQSGGAIGKTATIFQSWWLNYASALHKWFTTGTVEESARRSIGWMVSNAMAYTVMRQMWNKKTSAQGVFMGPMPSPADQLPVPPAWEAVRKVLATPFVVASMDEKKMKTHGIALLKTGISFLPGGIQAMQSFRGAKKEGWKGFSKSIVKYNPERFDLKSLW